MSGTRLDSAGLTYLLGKIKTEIDSSGENLLSDTNAMSLDAVAASGNRYWSSAGTLSSHGTATFVPIADSPCGASNGIELSSTAAVTTYHGLAFYQPTATRLTFEAGQTYVLSCYVKVISGAANLCQITVQDATNSGFTSYRFTPTSEWKRYSTTFTPTTDCVNKVVYFEMRYTSTGAVRMCGFKVEKSTRATDWSMSLKDMMAALHYSSGNTISSTGYVECVGRTAAAGKTLAFQIPLAKPIEPGRTLTLGSDTGIAIYYATGATAEQTVTAWEPTSVSLTYDDFSIRVTMPRSAVWVSATNQTVTVVLHNASISIS